MPWLVSFISLKTSGLLLSRKGDNVLLNSVNLSRIKICINSIAICELQDWLKQNIPISSVLKCADDDLLQKLICYYMIKHNLMPCIDRKAF